LLLAVLCGVTTVGGALVGGFLLMLMPVIQSGDPALGGLLLVFIGLAAVSLGREPNGVVHLAASKTRDLLAGSGRIPPPRLPGATESPESAESPEPADSAIGAKGVSTSGVA
jgi:branched-chain amino acid transport system permease protein